MKKLLFITALLAMGTMAMGETEIAGIKNQESKAEVLVKAEIVDDFFKITDIDGNPLILDFKKLPKMNYSGPNAAKASVEYKVTAKDTLSEAATLKMSFKSYENPGRANQEATVIIKNDDTTTTGTGEVINDSNRIEVNIGLDKDTKTMAKGETVVVGKINGIINSDLSNKSTGKYSGKVFLVATVQ